MDFAAAKAFFGVIIPSSTNSSSSRGRGDGSGSDSTSSWGSSCKIFT